MYQEVEYSYENHNTNTNRKGDSVYMISTVYSIQDVLVGFGQPILSTSEEAMKRDYVNWAKTKPEAEDKRLFKIGTFDDETGTLIPIIPECIMGGIEYGKE